MREDGRVVQVESSRGWQWSCSKVDGQLQLGGQIARRQDSGGAANVGNRCGSSDYSVRSLG
jgi:hypothetical protein